MSSRVVILKSPPRSSGWSKRAQQAQPRARLRAHARSRDSVVGEAPPAREIIIYWRDNVFTGVAENTDINQSIAARGEQSREAGLSAEGEVPGQEARARVGQRGRARPRRRDRGGPACPAHSRRPPLPRQADDARRGGNALDRFRRSVHSLPRFRDEQSRRALQSHGRQLRVDRTLEQQAAGSVRSSSKMNRWTCLTADRHCPYASFGSHHHRVERLRNVVGAQGVRGPGLLRRRQSARAAHSHFRAACATSRAR